MEDACAHRRPAAAAGPRHVVIFTDAAPRIIRSRRGGEGPGTGAGGSRRTGDPSKKTGARRAPAAAGRRRHAARTRPKREGARGGRGALGRAVGRGHAAARAWQRARPSSTARAPGMADADSGPTRSHRGRAGSAVDARPSSGPPDARPGAAERRGAAAAARGLQRHGPARRAEPRARLGGRHAARRVCSQRSQRSRAQNAGSARAAPALAERSVAQGF